MCLRHLSLSNLPDLLADLSSDDVPMSWLINSFEKGHTRNWDYVLRKLWKTPSGCTLVTNGGQELWLRGVCGKGSFIVTPQGGQRRAVEDSCLQRLISNVRKCLEKDPIYNVFENHVRAERTVSSLRTETIQGIAFPVLGDIREKTSMASVPKSLWKTLFECGLSLVVTYLALD